MNKSVVLVTGASSGIGYACASYLHSRAFRVYGASRSIHLCSDIDFERLAMDVADDASVEAAIALVVEREGRIDALVNAAGFGIAGAVEDTSIDEARRQFESNFFGVMRACNVVLPILRRQQSGVIINISSIAGRCAVPFQALYSASKFAVEGFTEALRMESKPFGVRVVLVEPGDFKTNFTQNRVVTRASTEDSPYYRRMRNALSVMEHDETNGPDPIAVARLVERIIADPAPRLRYTTGPIIERVAVHVRSLIPHRLYEALMMRYFRVT